MQLPTQLLQILFSQSISTQDKGLDQQLTNTQITRIENGYAVSNLVKVIEKLKKDQIDRSMTPLSRLELLKTINTSASKLYNWNIIIECLNQMRIKHNITADIKQLVLMGDLPIIQDSLLGIFKEYQILLTSHSSPSRQRSTTFDVRQSTPPVIQNSSILEQQNSGLKPYRIRNISMHQSELKESQLNQKVDLSNVSKNPLNATSPLEFFLSILQNRIQLSSKEATSLFVDNNKFLAHVVAKGVQGIFEPIIAYHQDVLENVHILIRLCDEKSLPFTLQALKLGLVSKSFEVATLTINVFISIHKEIYLRKFTHLYDQIYSWLTNLGGFQIILLSLKRHPQMVNELVILIVKFSNIHFQELFTFTLKQLIQNDGERIEFISEIFESLILYNQTKQELQQLGIIDDWIELAQRPQINGDHKICCVRLVCSIWRHYSDFINFERSQKILSLLNTTTKIKSLNVVFCSFQSIFSLLTYFAETKSSHAPVLYLSIAILLTENFHIYDIRIFILNNLEHIFLTTPTIPISLILEPLIQQALQLTTPCIGVLKFLMKVKNRNLSIKSVIQILDLLAQLSLYDIIFYKITKQLMIRLIEDGLSDTNQSSFVEFSSKYTKVALSIYFSSMKSQNRKKDIIQQQKRAQIIDILKSIIQLQNTDLNQRLQILISHTYSQIKEFFRQANKGMLKLLELFGDPDLIMKQFEIEANTKKDEEVFSARQDSAIHQSKYYGLNSRKTRLTKEEQFRLASLRKPNITNPQVQAQLENAQQAYFQKVQSQVDLLEQSSIILARQKVTLRKQLEKRSIEQGVSTKNQKDVIVNYLFPDGSRHHEIMKEAKKERAFSLINLQDEEDRDFMLVNIVLHRYNKFLRFAFTKFSNSGFTTNTPIYFDGLLRQKFTINIAEILKFLQEYELVINISKEEVIILGRDIHIQLLKQKSDLTIFDFSGFQHFFVQICIILGERPPSKAKHTPPFQCLQQILTHIRTVIASRNQNTLLFDDPDTQYFSQKELIIEFNKQLAKNEHFILPNGFKKVVSPDLKFIYSLTTSLQIPSSSKIAYEIINSIISQLGTQIIEPTTLKLSNVKARPDSMGQIQESTQIPQIDNKINPPKRYSSAPKQSPQKKRRVLDIEPKRELNIGLKIALSNYSLKERASVEQIANLLDDMVFAVENKRTTLDRSKHVSNKIEELKSNIAQKNEKLEELREKRRKERQIGLKLKLVTGRKKNNEQINKFNHDKKLAKEEKQKIDQSKFLIKEAHVKEIKQKIKHQQDQIRDNSDKAVQDTKQSKTEEFQKKKQEFTLFNKNQIKQFNEDIQKEKQRKATQVVSNQKSKQKKEQILDKQQRGSHAQDMVRIQNEKSINKEIMNRFNSQEYQDIFMKLNFQLTSIFEFLILETFYPIGKPASRDEITLKTFTWFAQKFKLWPEILNKTDFITIFRTITKEKLLVNNVPVGMNYDEFLQALYRTSIKGKLIFNIIQQKTLQKDQIELKSSNEYDQDESHDIKDLPVDSIKQNNFELSQIQKLNEVKKIVQRNISADELIDNYGDISQANARTLEGLLQYLNLPNDKKKLDIRFRQIIEEGHKPNRIRMGDLQQIIKG